ncbi:2'-5' RNA ligase family protein [Clostridium akagii]|uniref:2'-5' RNA ligase family protein n=1 Tax=Clostridium akagii TaxID=91623 RepID=UPI00047B697A|nr:2'-5' RNA ligase family protein [Clostridium akagii]
MKRSVILFPKFNNYNSINSIREKYYPLVKCIPPHITIVFPFESNISTNELNEHFKESLKGIKKFDIQLKDITGDFRDGFLFLNVKKGNDNIIELHDKLYSGILQNFLIKKITYCPHLTVGRLKEQKEFDNVINELSCFSGKFKTVIDKIFVENIDINEKSIIEFSFGLE